MSAIHCVKHNERYGILDGCPQCSKERRGVPTHDPIKDTASASAFDSSKEGRKNGKIRMELVFNGMPNALLALGKCMTWAIESKGYEEDDFLTVPDGTKKYRGAMLRHDLKEILGEVTDDESGLIHATHTAWNAMARLELLLREGKQP
jgi:hypothetical protein